MNPVYACEPLSDRGAQLYGGRFNAKGTPALYASLSVMTALREANQVGSLQPTTLVSYDAEIERVFDGRDATALAEHAMDDEALADAGWRDQMKAKGEARTQAFARGLIKAGYQGLLVRSFARGSRPDDLNLVLFAWGEGPPSRLTLIDDEQRLAQSAG